MKKEIPVQVKENQEIVSMLPKSNTVTCKSKELTVNVINQSPNELPAYTTSGAAGMDVRAWCEDNQFIADKADWDEESHCVRIFPKGRALIHTGLYFAVPQGYELQVRPRSGLALKQGVTVLNTPGTLDSDYRGELGIILINLSDDVFEVHTGDRIAQIIFNKIETPQLQLVDTLDSTERGTGGFGHSGVK